MSPRRENNNKNDNNTNNLHDVIQQLAVGQARLMQTMTQFIQASANNITTTTTTTTTRRHHHPTTSGPTSSFLEAQTQQVFLRRRPNSG
jgi:hypothetical protein